MNEMSALLLDLMISVSIDNTTNKQYGDHKLGGEEEEHEWNGIVCCSLLWMLLLLLLRADKSKVQGPGWW